MIPSEVVDAILLVSDIRINFISVCTPTEHRGNASGASGTVGVGAVISIIGNDLEFGSLEASNACCKLRICLECWCLLTDLKETRQLL